MPVDLTIVESTTELGQTVVEVVLEGASEPGPAGPGVPTGGTVNQVLTKDSGTDYDTSWQDAQGGGGGVTDADYLVGTAHAGLSAEIVVGTSPGGELGGTWASPTVDASHSGSTHAAVQAAAEATAAAALSAHLTDTADAHDASAISSVAAGNLAATDVQAALNELDSEKAATTHAHAGEDITSGTVADARIASTIARDSEVTSAISTHEADTTSVHGIADTSALALTANHPTNATFNDHSARHENGGTDEISIAGLDGTSTELANHLADTSDAHDASAISVVSTTLSGTGTDVQAVFEEIDNLLDDHSSRHENGGADEISIAGLDGTPTELTNHLNDTSDAHDASAISVADAGGFYTSTEVEAVLQEIAPQLGGGDWDATVVKQSDESVTSSTALQDDNELQFSITANVVYVYEMYLVYTGHASADIKTAMALSTGSFTAGIRTFEGIAAGDVSQLLQDLGNTTAIVSGASTSQKRVLIVRGFTAADATATFKLQWAQNASNGTATIVYAGSFIRYRAMTV